jgi:tetratricopeptide (TPR) repeat protein
MTHKKLCLLLLCSVIVLSGWAQSDSLQAALDTAKNQYKVKALNEFFRAYHEKDPARAVGYAREALNLATEINDKKGQAAAYNNLGIAYKTQGALDKALEYYLTSLRIYESLNNKEGIATTKSNIATIYSMKKDYGQAMKYMEASYALFVEMKDEDKIIRSMNNLGNLHSEIQLYEKAMSYFSQAYQLSEKKGNIYADPLMNMGNLYFRQNNYQRAVENYEKALELERKSNNKLGALNIIINLGITYTKAKQPKPAQIYLDEALLLSNELQAYAFHPTIYKTIAENYSNTGKWKEAYEAQLKYDETREKIYGEESTRNIAQMEMIMEFQQKDKEFDLLKQQDEITKLELRNSRLFIVLFILAGLVILGALNFYFHRRKIRRV